MRKQLAGVIFAVLCICGIMAVCGYLYLERNMGETTAENELVMLNEIEQIMTDSTGQSPAQAQMEALRTQLRADTAEARREAAGRLSVFYLCLTAVCLISGVLYLYYKIVRPFYKLEKYADSVAKGDLTVSLEYERTNFFGAFTWAFDHMREEIRTARRNEERAITENKTIIATLSHDIKTPIASIRAYAEGLEANLDTDYEQRERYLGVIMKKCDEVSRLVNDLVLHSLSELERLEIRTHKISMCGLLEEALRDWEYPHLNIRRPLPEAELPVDEKRMTQVLLNLLENAKKYAPDALIEVWAAIADGRYEIHVRDYGSGIAPQDMPFVFEKFYRGENVAGKQGSGLGLYIVKYIMNRMEGDAVLYNHKDGLEAVVWLPLS